MDETFEPPIEFLTAVIKGDEELGRDEADSNLQKLIKLTRSDHEATRTWATLVLAQRALNSPDIRTALLCAAEDEDDFVRAEAIVGIAKRDPDAALPLLQRELARGSVAVPIFEAAKLLAHWSLVEHLHPFLAFESDTFLVRLTHEAFAACQTNREAAE